MNIPKLDTEMKQKSKFLPLSCYKDTLPPQILCGKKGVMLFHDTQLKSYTKFCWNKDQVVLPRKQTFNRTVNIYKVLELIVFTVQQLFTSKSENVANGAWEKCKNCARFTGKQLCQSPLCNKIVGLQHAAILKMTPQHR